MNSILVIHPYKYQGVWVFDDPKVGLVQEPFVAGSDVILDRMAERVADSASAMTVLFSTTPFPGHQFEFQWQREEHGGNWYYSPDFELEGWLCPALFKYFERAPERIFAQVKPRRADSGA